MSFLRNSAAAPVGHGPAERARTRPLVLLRSEVFPRLVVPACGPLWLLGYDMDAAFMSLEQPCSSGGMVAVARKWAHLQPLDPVRGRERGGITTGLCEQQKVATWDCAR